MSNNFFNNLGLNFNLPTHTLQHAEQAIGKMVENVANPFGNFFDQNQSVFTGDVKKEIEDLSMLYFNVNAAMNLADKNAPRSLDLNG